MGSRTFLMRREHLFQIYAGIDISNVVSDKSRGDVGLIQL